MHWAEWLALDSPFAHSRESHIRWATMFHNEAGKQQDIPGPFQPWGGLHFFFKHLWVSQATVYSHAGLEGGCDIEIGKGNNGDLLLIHTGVQKWHSSRWARRGVPREEKGYFVLNTSLSCGLLISLWIPSLWDLHLISAPASLCTLCGQPTALTSSSAKIDNLEKNQLQNSGFRDGSRPQVQFCCV